MTDAADDCPTEDELRAFAAGRLPGPGLDVLTAHVKRCGTCQIVLERLEKSWDSIEAPLSVPVPAETGSPRPGADPGATATHVPSRQWVRVAPNLDSNLRSLLQSRLFVISALAAFVFAAVLILTQASEARRQVGGGWVHQSLRAGSALFAAGVCVVLRMNPSVSLRKLRGLELGLLTVAATTLAFNHYHLLITPPGLGFEGPRHAGSYSVAVNGLCVTAWFMLIVGYGVLIPNVGQRAALVSAALTAIPCLVIAASAARSEPVRDNRFLLLAWTGTVLAVANGLATYGSSRISALQREAFELRRLGPYQLKRRLGAGGMGEVYLAEHRLLKRPCAVKLIRPERAGDPALLRRFEREVQAMSRLSHFNTVEVFDFGLSEEGTFYYVMEYLPGLTLADLVATHGRLSPARAVFLARQICAALNAAHASGLVHRDIKPSNVIVGRFGGRYDVAKLLDFGLVRSVDDTVQTHLTYQGALIGTPDYMAPEQASGRGADARSDLYSLGAVLYYLLSGRPPFRGATVMDVLDAHRHDPVPPFTTHAVDVPLDLEAIVLRCLAKEPAARFADALSLDRALADWGCQGLWDESTAEAWWLAHSASAETTCETRPEAFAQKT